MVTSNLSLVISGNTATPCAKFMNDSSTEINVISDWNWVKFEFKMAFRMIYDQVSNISCTLVGNKIVDHSDVVGASPGGTAPTTSSFST